MKNGNILKNIQNKSEVTYCVEWSKDGKYLCTTEMDGTLNIYDAKTFELLSTAPGDQPSESRAYGCDLDFANMPGRIFVATEERHIKEFEFKNNILQLKHKYFAHFDAVKSLTVEGKQKLLLSTGRDGSVRLWDAKENLKPIASLVGHQDNVVTIVLIIAQSCICTRQWDYRGIRWRGPDSQPLETLLSIVWESNSEDIVRLIQCDSTNQASNFRPSWYRFLTSLPFRRKVNHPSFLPTL